MRRPLLCVLLTACGINPAYDAADSQGPPPAPSQPTTDTPTSDPPAPTTQEDTSVPGDSSGETAAVTATDPADTSTTASTTLTTTTDTTTHTTGPDACIIPGEPCDGSVKCCGDCMVCDGTTCTPDDSKCAPCGSCSNDGLCEPYSEGTPCIPSSPCISEIWGFDQGICYQTMQEGKCSDAGECTSDCGKGKEITRCDSSECQRADHNCLPGSTLGQIDVASICHTGNTTAGNCVNTCDDEVVTVNVCDDKGKCKTSASFSCTPYVCDVMTAVCTTSCQTSQDCHEGKPCIASMCTM